MTSARSGRSVVAGTPLAAASSSRAWASRRSSSAFDWIVDHEVGAVAEDEPKVLAGERERLLAGGHLVDDAAAAGSPDHPEHHAQRRRDRDEGQRGDGGPPL